MSSIFTLRYSLRAVCVFQDIGAGKGKYYAVNFPMRDGIDDESYGQIFKPVSIIIFKIKMEF